MFEGTSYVVALGVVTVSVVGGGVAVAASDIGYFNGVSSFLVVVTVVVGSVVVGCMLVVVLLVVSTVVML